MSFSLYTSSILSNLNVLNSGSLCAKYSLLDMIRTFFFSNFEPRLNVYLIKAVHNSSVTQNENDILITMSFVYIY